MAINDRPTRMLLVEDDEDDYIIIRDALSEIKGSRFELDWIQDYQKGLQASRTKPYDIYLLDYRLGERTGLQLLKEFQAGNLKAPVVILTGQGDYQVDVEAMRSGAADYLEKDLLTPNLLERAIRYAVERFRTLEELRLSRARFRGVFMAAAIGIAIVDAQGRIMESNPSLVKMLGYSRVSLSGIDMRQICHPNDLNRNDKLFEELVSQEREYYQCEGRYRRKNGYWIWGRLTVSLLRGNEDPAQFAISMMEDITGRKHAEKALRESEEQLRILSQKLLEAQEKERQHVAQELHDSVGASLAAIKYILERKMEEMPENPAPEGISLQKVVHLVQETIKETRRISTNLRPSMLDDLGIIATIRWSCREFEEVYTGIRLIKQLLIREEEIPDLLKIEIYRVLQEALNNIAKHSESDLVRICLKKTNGNIELSIEDNGRGFDIKSILSGKNSSAGMGIAGMRRRTELSGGAFSISSGIEAGTTIKAYWPARRA